MGRCRRLSRTMAFIIFAYQSIWCLYLSNAALYVCPSQLGIRMAMDVIVHALHSIESKIKITRSVWHIAAALKRVCDEGKKPYTQ